MLLLGLILPKNQITGNKGLVLLPCCTHVSKGFSLLSHNGSVNAVATMVQEL